MLKKNTFVIIITLLIGIQGFAQEIVTGLHVNQVVRERALANDQQNPYAHYGFSDAGLDTIPMNLPFLDDFSALGVFPSSQRWIDRFAFENDDFPIFPVNVGAMTDKLFYKVPLGILGNLVDSIMIRKKVEGIFIHREKALNQLFPGK